MKKFLLGILIASSTLLFAMADDAPWLTDVRQAQVLAQKENKMILLDFTGSDWCGWCMKLHKEVFSQPEFKDYAKKNLVLVEVDFPKRKKLSDAQTRVNQVLAQRYGVKGYPSIVVLSKQGHKVGQLGYVEGGANAFIAALEKATRKTDKAASLAPPK